MPNNAASGTTTPTLGVETTLATVTVPTGGRTYQPYVDFSALAGDEVLEIVWLTKARAADSLQVVTSQVVGSTSREKLWVGAALTLEAGNTVELRIRQDNGTARAANWSIKSVPDT